MNILVTGAAGFVGQRLARFLAERGNRVYGLYHDHFPESQPEITWLQGDVTNYARMLELLVNCNIEHIYNLAARSIVRTCASDPLGCFCTNILGTATTLEAARHAPGVSGIVQAESDKSYGTGPVPYAESQALNPGGIYEASKAAAGLVAMAYHRNYELPVFTVRSANIFGPGDRNLTRLIPRTITRILAGEKPQITEGAQKYVREFIYVDDACACLTRLMAVGPWGEAVNIGSGTVMTIGAVIELICAEMHVPYKCEVWPAPSNLREIPVQRLNLVKLYSLLTSYRPLPFVEGLRRTIAAYRKGN